MRLEDIAEGDAHARWVVANHIGSGPERPRCVICDTWWPCDLVGLAALAVRLQALVGAAPLMLEALEASEEVARLQGPFIAGLNSSDASHEVKQEASDRLGAAQRRWWDLRGRALKAARGEG